MSGPWARPVRFGRTEPLSSALCPHWDVRRRVKPPDRATPHGSPAVARFSAQLVESRPERAWSGENRPHVGRLPRGAFTFGPVQGRIGLGSLNCTSRADGLWLRRARLALWTFTFSPGGSANGNCKRGPRSGFGPDLRAEGGRGTLSVGSRKGYAGAVPARRTLALRTKGHPAQSRSLGGCYWRNDLTPHRAAARHGIPLS